MKTNTQPSLRTEDFVESLQHDPKCTLLFGKNNVYIQTSNAAERVPGYLSLHHNLNGHSVAKWTPNFLMNREEQHDCDEVDSSEDDDSINETEVWRSVLGIEVTDMKYIYCHQQPEGRGTLVVVNRQGLSWPPLNFHDSCHMLGFVSSLEKALLPTGRLDPPASTYRKKWRSLSDPDSLQASLSPSSKESSSLASNENEDCKNGDASCESADTGQNDIESENEASDFVFNVSFTNSGSDVEDEVDSLSKQHQHPWPPNYTEEALSLRCKSTRNVSKLKEKSKDKMRRRIMSCVFYQWLAYCRHMKSLRAYVIDFVFDRKEVSDFNYSDGLTEGIWERIRKEKYVDVQFEFRNCIYMGGCEDLLREQVWPYLLNISPWGLEDSDFFKLKETWSSDYESYLKKWKNFESKLTSEDCSHDGDGNQNLEAQRMAQISEIIQKEMDNLKILIDDQSDDFFNTISRMACSYFFHNSDVRYTPNSCEILAVFLLNLKNEAVAYNCFEKYTVQLKRNFEISLDTNLVNLRSLIHLMDPELFEYMHQNCDFSHLYFTQQWFLLDFSEEFSIADVPVVYEAIWSSDHVSENFPLFIALALIQSCRDQIIQQEMGFLDVRNLFREKARNHDVRNILDSARKLVDELQQIRDKKQ